eukprot:TRINITY_DN14521_c0_g1_i1.p1 TRINITY_DN14521_c0_g1~~TRINITY_DN14521_c0_g1_i1.p1  ORF type:complete len:652 (-),score=148.48 TRINITY_DN14521_c0_g1_i1:43-1998(-)
MKRERSDEPENKAVQDDLSDDDFGPRMEDFAPQPKAKKAKKVSLKFEKVYLQALPCAEMYEKSYMHRKTVTHTAVAPITDFILTGSTDGHVKFWKKLPKGIEFVKHFLSHLGPIVDIAITSDGLHAASCALDSTLKIYDVVNFDMMNIINLGFTPSACCWITKAGSPKPMIAVANSDPKQPEIHIYDFNYSVRQSADDPDPSKGLSDLSHVVLKNVHKNPVIQMKYNEVYDTVISIDSKGMVEYWDADRYGDHAFPQDKVQFEFKSATDLYEFPKRGTIPFSLSVSPNGQLWACMGEDRIVRVFKFETGKLLRTFDESLAIYASYQKEGEDHPYYLDPLDFGRRMAVENQLTKSWQNNKAPASNVIFDGSSNFICYSTMVGIKLQNLVTGKLVNVTGKVENTERFLHLSLYQGRTEGSISTGTLNTKATPDPTFFATAYNKPRFYLFTRDEPSDHDGADYSMGRDVFNERPQEDDIKMAPGRQAKQQTRGKSAIIHTTKGDIHVTLFGDKCPKTVENFSVHSKNNYYAGVIFHRIIKSFMIQTGDPLGDGTGGTSIWNKPFEDEFHPSLKHDVPFTLSMANAGPNTNGSQFFITTVPCPHLDNKHTVFGRVTKGMDVVSAIERIPTFKTKEEMDRPQEEVKIINIDVDFTK